MSVIKFPKQPINQDRPTKQPYSNMGLIAKLRMKLIKLLVGRGTVILNANISLIDYADDGIRLMVRDMDFAIIVDNNFSNQGIENKIFLIRGPRKNHPSINF